jgi:integrase/recombinase XerD
MVGANGFEPSTSWSRTSGRNTILLARLALFCVEHAGLGRYLAANGLILDSPWWASLVAWQDGKPRRRYEKNVTHQIEELRKNRLTRPRSSSRRTTPLSGLLERYLQHLAVKGFAETTLRVRRVHMRMFLTWCKTNRIAFVEQIKRTSLEAYQRYLFDYRKKDGRPLAVASQLTRLAPLKVWFRWMNRRNYIHHDPALELELPRISYKLPGVLNKDEAELVLQQPNVQRPLGIRDRALLEMLYSTGIRRMELLQLKLYDVDKKHGLVTIRQGKGKRDRVVPVGERALFWFEQYLIVTRAKIVKQPDDSIAFLTAAGEPFTPNHLSWLARRHVKASGTGKNGACHIFRHTMATLMLEGGADIRYIQAMLGHVRLDTTKIYTHVSIRMLKQIHTATHPGARLDSQITDAAATQNQQEDTRDSSDSGER